MRQQGQGRGFSLITFILLIILIVVFHVEIFIIGVRIYSSFVESAAADNLLAGYYRTSANFNSEYSDYFYKKSLDLYFKELEKAPASEKAKLNVKIGRYYECQRGTTIDLGKARTYYLAAKQASSARPELTAEIDQSLARVDEEMKNPSVPPACTKWSDRGFFNNGLGGLNFLWKKSTPESSGQDGQTSQSAAANQGAKAANKP